MTEPLTDALLDEGRYCQWFRVIATYATNPPPDASVFIPADSSRWALSPAGRRFTGWSDDTYQLKEYADHDD